MIRIAVMSCAKYSDCWLPFFTLFREFWPDCPYPVTLLTDRYDPACNYPGIRFAEFGNVPWFQMFADFCGRDESVVLMMQEDFFLDAPVNAALIGYARKQLERRKAGLVRLYPCPGSNEDIGDPYLGSVAKGTPYRVSCQASLWSPAFIRKLEQFGIGTPKDFEIIGSEASSLLAEPVLAWQRDVKPYPLSYLVTAVVKGRWIQGAKDLCALHGIDADFSKRGSY